MAEFEPAIKLTLVHEGGHVNDPDDPGGATAYGISLRWLKTQGELGDIDMDGDVDVDDIRALTPERAAMLYRIEWWDKYGYGRIVSQGVANKVFDLSVNMGPKQAHKILQRAVRACGVPCEDDGILGPKTLAAVNARTPVALLPAIRAEAAGFYRYLTCHKPRLKKYIRGWLRRAYA